MVEGADSLEFGLEFAPGDFQIVGLLGAKPIAIGETEEAAKTQACSRKISIRYPIELNQALNSM